MLNFIHLVGKERGRYTLLVLSLICLFVIHPITTKDDTSRIIFDCIIAAIVFSALWAFSRTKRVVLIGLCLGVPAVLGRFAHNLGGFESLFVAGYICLILFNVLILYVIFVDILRERAATFDTIFGAMSGYFVVGLIFAAIYNLIEYGYPGSFNFGEGFGSNMDTFIYYSFVTITTLGFGDVTPQLPIARSLSTLEAVIGQMYLAIFVARLVGLHAVHVGKDKTIFVTDDREDDLS